MKRFFWLVALILVMFLVVSSCAPAKEVLPPSVPELAPAPEFVLNFEEVRVAFESISETEIAQHIQFLTSKECNGRLFSTKGSYLAGDFLAEKLKEYGIFPLMKDGSYFQDVPYEEWRVYSRPGGRHWVNMIRAANPGKSEAEIKGRNILGFLPGKTDEYILIGGHYDHLGEGDSYYDEKTLKFIKTWYPGADDNASGVAAILAIAKALGKLSAEGKTPQRGIIFAFFDAEEISGEGVIDFVLENPLPIKDKIVAALVFDMVGRNARDELYIIGSLIPSEMEKRNPLMFKALNLANEYLGFKFDYSYSDFGATDAGTIWNFVQEKEKTPTVFLYSGSHEDWHKITDTPDKIDNQKVQNVARLAFLTVWQLANFSEKPDYLEE